MKVYEEIYSLSDFACWSGAKYNYDKIIAAGNDKAFLDDLEEIYPEGISETELNDILWFDDDFCKDFMEHEDED